jgi:DMSO/TMAO reductase YedYZ molybdopterin-dependent catalytic subunit
MSGSLNRRHFLGAAALGGITAGLVEAATEMDGGGTAQGGDRSVGPGERTARPLLTDARDFVDVSRGKPKPFTLRGEALSKARLTPETWRLEIVGDGSSTIARPRSLQEGTALDLPGLLELARAHSVKYLKAMQCNNIPAPLGQGLWEGVPLREVVRLVGKVSDVRRVYYWGFHNEDPAQVFQSSLGYNRVLETPPWEPPALVAFRLNGREIPLERGGPVRMIVPWAHGFKSIKWLQRIVLTNDYKANDTYALQNNDPESSLKTAAYLGREDLTFRAGEPVVIEGIAIAGCSGLKRVEYWLREAASSGAGKELDDDDPDWRTADWRPCELMDPPGDWRVVLPTGTAATDIWGFDPRTGRPKEWPLLYSSVPWTARLAPLKPGSYELRARTVDLNGFAQPEPRPYQKSGMNLVPRQRLTVTA